MINARIDWTRFDPRLLLAVLIISLPVLCLLGAAFFLSTGLETAGQLLTPLTKNGAALARSIVAAVGSSTISVLIALMVGRGLAEVCLGQRGSTIIRNFCFIFPIALIPLLIGTASFAFLYRDVGTAIAVQLGGDNRGSLAAIVVEITAQIIRYAPLASWLALIGLTNVSVTMRRYVQQTGIEGYDYVSVHLMSRWLVPLLVVAAFAFQDAANDLLVAQLALKPSIATHSELIGHSLSREYFISLSLGSPEIAFSQLVLSGTVIALGLALVFVFLASAFLHLTRAMRLRSVLASRTGRNSKILGPWPALSLLILVVIPLLVVVATMGQPTWSYMRNLVPSAVISLLAAIASWSLSAPLVFILRDNRTQDKAAKAILMVCGIAAAIGFIPSLALAAAILGLAYEVDIIGDGANGSILVVSQIIRFTPISFILLSASAIAIPSSRLDYIKGLGVNIYGRFVATYLRPMTGLHAATMLIVFNLILNESVISGTFQGQIPNLSDFALRAATGRSADYGVIAGITWLEIGLFGPLLLAWGVLTGRGWDRRNA